MNAYEIPELRFSLPAGSNVERARFVSVNGNGEGVAAIASTQIVGVSMNKADAGEVLEVADGIVCVEASGAITAGTAVYSDANGKVTSSGTVSAGVAITSATGTGQLVSIKL